jgi:hypothetical protein
MARIITNPDDVPDGWKRITDLTNNSTDAKILSEAHTAGDLAAVKLIRTTSEIRTGPVWVDAVQAAAILSRCQARRDSLKSDAQSSVPAGSSDEVAGLLREISQSLSSIAFSLQSIAMK